MTTYKHNVLIIKYGLENEVKQGDNNQALTVTVTVTKFSNGNTHSFFIMKKT